jgi:glycosyltransferase involved in cell wall biosynthesis
VGPVEPEFDPVLRRAISDAGLEAHVTMVGPVDHADMPRVLSTATVCVAPSSPDHTERPLAPFPLKILEYMACRRPVVAPRRPVVEEVVRHGEDGLLFEPGDAAGLAEALLLLLTDDALRDRIAEAGYATARARFPASAVRRLMLEVYRSLAAPAEVLGRPAVAPSPGLQTAPDTTTARHPTKERTPERPGVRSGERPGPRRASKRSQ